MAEIRRATEADVEALVGLLRLLHAEAPNYADEPFEDDQVTQFVYERLASTHLVDNSLVLVAVRGGQVVGTLIAVLIKHWLNRRLFAGELVLYIQPGHRGTRAFPALVAGYETWAASQGAVKTVLGVSSGIASKRTVRSYERLGYTLDDNYTVSKPCSISEP